MRLVARRAEAEVVRVKNAVTAPRTPRRPVAVGVEESPLVGSEIVNVLGDERAALLIGLARVELHEAGWRCGRRELGAHQVISVCREITSKMPEPPPALKRRETGASDAERNARMDEA
jgi:hypothetical protein